MACLSQTREFEEDTSSEERCERRKPFQKGALQPFDRSITTRSDDAFRQILSEIKSSMASSGAVKMESPRSFIRSSISKRIAWMRKVIAQEEVDSKGALDRLLQMVTIPSFPI